MLLRGEADAMICGTVGTYHEHYDIVEKVFGFREGAHVAGAMNALLLPSGNTFIADTYVNDDPTPEQLAEVPPGAEPTAFWGMVTECGTRRVKLPLARSVGRVRGLLIVVALADGTPLQVRLPGIPPQPPIMPRDLYGGTDEDYRIYLESMRR